MRRMAVGFTLLVRCFKLKSRDHSETNMSEVAKPSQLLAAINLPPQDLQRLSFCGSAKASSVSAWANNLQATKVMQTSSMLFSAIPEIPRLKTDYANRLEILELLRPSVQYCILGLQKSFLNQPLIMPPAAQKTVVVAQSLQKNMIDGYIATIVQITHKGKANKQTFELLAKAIHRAITGIGLLFFRNYQIYAQTPPNLWATINILYQVAIFYKLTDHAVADSTLKSGKTHSIEAAYKRVLMLALAKTNQISQGDIELSYAAFELWCAGVKLNSELSSDTENFFAINLASSQGPIYKSKIAAPESGRYLELDFKNLLSALAKQSSKPDEVLGSGANITVPKEFPDSLLKHLLDTWSNVAQRKHDRKPAESYADVCVGFSDCHYFVCNGQDFDYFLRSSGTHEPQKISRFSQGLTPASHLNEGSDSSPPVHRIAIQNVSAGGYCVLWREEISAKVSAGEIIGIKLMGQRTWSVGIVRWVRQLKNASQLGLQLLANNAKPYGIAQTYDHGGHSEYMRGLFIPPSKQGHGNPTLLTASVPFQEFDKVRIIDGEREWTAKLDKLVFSTKSVQQFRFRNLEAGVTKQNLAPGDHPTFGSDWD